MKMVACTAIEGLLCSKYKTRVTASWGLCVPAESAPYIHPICRLFAGSGARNPLPLSMDHPTSTEVKSLSLRTNA
jgi:hypothetical protein